MNKSILAVLVAATFAAMPAVAAEPEQGDKAAKECVIRCVAQSETIQQKIERLKNEIEQGKSTYSAAELQKLESKLKEANDLLNSLSKPK